MVGLKVIEVDDKVVRMRSLGESIEFFFLLFIGEGDG